MWASRLDVGALLRALRADSGPPLFYFLEKPLVAAGETLRLCDRISRALPLLATILLAAAARALPAGRPRLLFLSLLATSPLLLLYAAEARAYAVLALADLLLFLLVSRGAATPPRLAAIALTTAAALSLHYLAAFFVAALAICAAAGRRWRAVFAMLAGAALFLPWLPILRGQPEAATAWMREPPATAAAGFLSALGGAGRVPAPFGPKLPAAFFAAGLAIAAVALAALAPSLRHRAVARDAAAVSLLALAGVLIASFFRPVAFPGRSEMAVLPVWLFGIAAASETSRLARRAALAMALLGACATALLLARSPRGPSDVPPALEAASRLSRPGDTLVAGGRYYLPARLESDRGQLSVRLWAFPAEIERHPGWFAAAPPSRAEDGRLAQRLAALPPGGRALLLLQPLSAPPALLRLLASRGTLLTMHSEPDAVLLCWTPAPRVPS